MVTARFYLWLSLLCVAVVPFVYRFSEWRFPFPAEQIDWITNTERFMPMVVCFIGAGFAYASQWEGDFHYIRPEYDLLTTVAALALVVSGGSYPFQGARTWIKWVFIMAVFFLGGALVVH